MKKHSAFPMVDSLGGWIGIARYEQEAQIVKVRCGFENWGLA